jgi:polyhydroxyalkanoate synthesis regulator phasin
MRKILVPVALTAALAGGAGALAFGPAFAGAQTASTATPAASATADPATAPRPKPFADAIKKLVDDGTLTQAQADKVIAALEAARPEGGPGIGGRIKERIGERIGAELGVAAKALGISEDDLKTALRDGKTLADVATDKGVAVQSVIDALVADATSHIDQAVTDGKLTAEQATKMKADLTARVTTMVNEGPKLGGHHHGPDGDFDGPPAPAASGTGASTATA